MTRDPTKGGGAPVQMAPSTSAKGEGTAAEMDETEYLLRNPANARRLRESVRQMEPLVRALEGAKAQGSE